MEPLRNLIAAVQGQLGRLSARERRMVIACAAAVAGFLIFLGFFYFSSTADAYRRRTDMKTGKLKDVLQLAATYREAEQAREGVERQLSNSNVRLISYLTEKGTQAGLDIRTLNPKGDVTLGDGRIVESAVDVTLTDVQLDKLVAFLSQVERGPGMVKVKRIRIEPRVDQGTVTAWTTIATYSLKQQP